jgi:hypothetical protein
MCFDSCWKTPANTPPPAYRWRSPPAARAKPLSSASRTSDRRYRPMNRLASSRSTIAAGEQAHDRGLGSWAGDRNEDYSRARRRHRCVQRTAPWYGILLLLAPREACSMNRARILIIDDELETRLALRIALVTQGNEVVEARSGEDALANFREPAPERSYRPCRSSSFR